MDRVYRKVAQKNITLWVLLILNLAWGIIYGFYAITTVGIINIKKGIEIDDEPRLY